jgi:hypothetical protein
MEKTMGCFCRASLAPLSDVLRDLDAPPSSLPPQAAAVQDLSAWLSARALPAEPWQPDRDWLLLPIPKMQMSPPAVATISAMGSLRAQALAQHGLDLLDPAQATAFARIIATMNARLSTLAQQKFDPQPWTRLATLNDAIDQVTEAKRAGLLSPPPDHLLALTTPAGIPMQRWSGLLDALRALAPMLAAVTQLDTDATQLATALRSLARLALPPLAAPQLLAQLTSALSAVTRLQQSLGINPLQAGLPAVQRSVQEKLATLLPTLQMPPPALPVMPTSFATPAVVHAATQAHALAALNWQVPAALPAINAGLATCAFAAQLQALGITTVHAAPCDRACDAAKIMRGLAA